MYNQQIVSNGTPTGAPVAPIKKQNNTIFTVLLIVGTLIIIGLIVAIIIVAIQPEQQPEQPVYDPTLASLGSIDTLQSATTSLCAASEKYSDTNKTYTLKDSRDNNSYQVRRLDDGNCWMVNNLRLAGGTTISSADSDVVKDYTLPASNAESFQNNDEQNMFDATVKTGAYYNWYAATAGTGNTLMTSGEASGSICPKGWRLPKVNKSQNEFETLYQAYGSRASFDAAFLPIYAGRYYDTSLFDQNQIAYYWSASAYAKGLAYQMTVSSQTSLYPEPSAHYLERAGFSVRCILSAS
jgi:uncharacterized protein (TIGR02145 family)